MSMGIKETLEYIHNVKWSGSKLGLERTEKLLRALGNPEKQLKFVHVAGTNGKGSTSACIASVLREAGYKTGLFISPYVMCFNERIQVDGEYITDDELEAMTNEVRPITDVMKDPPTEFELITALAMKYYVNKGCDIVVLEVGLGGRLDSTNVIETPELAVITAIGYDHIKELGPTLTDIAREKAGIIKNGGDVVIYGGEPEVINVFEQKANELGAGLYKADFSRLAIKGFCLEGIRLELEPYGEINLPLAGSYQPYNATLAVTAIELLRNKGYKISDDDIIKGISKVKWPGRFEILGRKPVFILDGSHNPQGMEVTAESLKCHFNDKKFIFIIGVMADKDIDAMVVHITPLAKAFITVSPDNPRAMESFALAEKLKRFGVQVTDCGAVGKGVSEALKTAGEDDIICALGSFFMSPEVRETYSALRELADASEKEATTEL